MQSYIALFLNELHISAELKKRDGRTEEQKDEYYVPSLFFEEAGDKKRLNY